MALAADDFTGTNGDPWSATWTGARNTGGSSTIDGNRGKQVTSAAGGYTDYRSDKLSYGTTVDGDLTGTLMVPTLDEAYPQVWFRADSTLGHPSTGTGYFLSLEPVWGNLQIMKRNVGTQTTISGDVAFTFAAGTTYNWRVQWSGTTLRAKVWTGSEPGGWTVSVTDSTFTSAGYMGLSLDGGSPAAAVTAYWDDVSLAGGTAVASASSATVSSASTITATRPTGTADGDFLVAFVACTPEGPAPTAPSGWTQVGDISAAVGFGRIFTRVASGEPASWAFGASATGTTQVHVLRVTGAGDSLDIAPSWASSAAGSTTHAAPSISPTGTGSVLICGFFAIVESTTASWTAPSGMTEATDVASTSWVASCTDSLVLSAAGATGTKTATSSVTSTAPYGSLMFSLAVSSTPGGGGGGGGGVAVATGTPTVGGTIRASHFGGSALAGLIVRDTHVTVSGAITTPRAGGWVRASDLLLPTVASGGTGGGGGGGGGGGSSTAVLLGASGNGVGDGTFAAQLTSGVVQVAATWNDSLEASTAQWTIQPGNEFGSWSGPLDLAVGGMFKNNGESWSAAAAGSYDSRWDTCLSAIATAWGGRNKANLYIRFAHEMNLSGSNWSVSSGERADYITAHRRFVDKMRTALPGANAVWGVNDGTSTSLGLDFTTAYPGDDWVDIIGIDTYNQYPWVNDQGSWDSKITSSDSGGPIGIETWRQFASSKGKALCFPEWANNGDTGGEGGGGDSPFYISAMHDYFVAHAGNGAGQVAYAVIFNQWVQFSLHPTTIQPNSWARYKAIF